MTGIKIMKQYFIYIVTNKQNGVLYTGITSNLIKRIYEHKEKIFDGFSKKYNCNKLVYFEIFDNVNIAIAREKQIKLYKRAKKIALIDKSNPDWKDLYSSVIF
jgi:putative endonuclease